MKISRNILIGAMAVVLAMGISSSIIKGLYERKIDRIENIYSVERQELNTRISAAEAYKVKNDSLEIQYTQYQDSTDKVIDWYEWNTERLEGELVDAWNIVFDADIDENYAMIHNRYPTEDSLEYPFSGEQVKGIALDLTRLAHKDSIIINYLGHIETMEEKLDTCNFERIRLEMVRHDLEVKTDSLFVNMDAKLEEQEEALKKAKRKHKWKWLSNIGSFIAGIVVNEWVRN